MSTRYFTNSFCRRDQEQYAKKLKMPTGSLKELKRAYIDVNFYNLAEIRALSRKFGKISPMCLTQIYLAMSAAEDARIDEDAILDILENAEIENIQDFIPYCIEKSLIKLYREKIADESQKKTIISGSKNGLPDSDSDIILIKEIDTPEMRQALKLARARLKESGRDIDQIGLDALVMRYFGRWKDLLAALKHTATLTVAKNIYDPPEIQKAQAIKAAEPTVRRPIDNYIPPTKEQLKPLTEEQKTANKKLIEEKLGKVRRIA